MLPPKPYLQMSDELIELLTNMQTIPELRSDERSPRRIAYLLLLAQRLARVADYCNLICERTIFIVEGTTGETLVQAS